MEKRRGWRGAFGTIEGNARLEAFELTLVVLASCLPLLARDAAACLLLLPRLAGSPSRQPAYEPATTALHDPPIQRPSAGGPARLSGC